MLDSSNKNSWKIFFLLIMWFVVSCAPKNSKSIVSGEKVRGYESQAMPSLLNDNSLIQNSVPSGVCNGKSQFYTGGPPFFTRHFCPSILEAMIAGNIIMPQYDPGVILLTFFAFIRKGQIPIAQKRMKFNKKQAEIFGKYLNFFELSHHTRTEINS